MVIDLTNREDLYRLVNVAVETYGRIDVLITAVSCRRPQLGRQPTDSFQVVRTLKRTFVRLELSRSSSTVASAMTFPKSQSPTVSRLTRNSTITSGRFVNRGI